MRVKDFSRYSKPMLMALSLILTANIMVAQIQPERINPLLDSQNLQDIDFLDENQHFLISTGKTYKSVDSGDTWLEIPFLEGGSQIQIEGNTIGILSSDRLVLSTNGGGLWNIVFDESESGTILDFYITPNQSIYLLVTTGLFRSTNAGISWENMTTPEVFYKTHFISDEVGFATDDVGKIYHTSDSGNTWEVVYEDAEFPCYARDFDFPSNMVGYVCAYPGRVFKTTDGGESWTLVAEPLLTPYSISFADENIGIISQEDSELLRTEDGGVTWESIELTDSWASIFRVKYFQDEEVVALGPGSRIYRSSDLGQTWKQQTCNVEEVLALDAFSDEKIYFLGESEVASLSTSGTNCEFLNTDISVFYNDPRDIEMINEELGYAVIDGGHLKRTQDGGETWEQVSFTVEGTEGECSSGFDLTFANGVLYMGSPCWPRFFKSVDLGYTWTRSEDVVLSGNVHPHSDDLIYVYVHGVGTFGSGVYKSINGGINWEPITMPDSPMRSAFFVTEEIGYAACANSLYKTIDGGDSWELSPGPDDGGFTAYRDMVFLDENRGWLLHSGVYETIDGGDTWVELNTGNGSIRELEYFGNTLYAAGIHGRIYKKEFSEILSSDEASLENRNSFTVVPNPVDEKGFILQIPRTSVKKFSHYAIMDLHGRTLSKVKIGPQVNGQRILPDPSLANGVYLIQLLGDSYSEVKKLVLQR